MTDAASEDEARALARLDETGAAIVAGVDRQVPGWARAQVERLHALPQLAGRILDELARARRKHG